MPWCATFTPRRVEQDARLLYAFAQSDATHIPLADKSVDLVFTSPPYLAARTYGIGAQRGVEDWIDWMLKVIRECLRVSKGAVMVNCAGQTKDRNYQPGPEGLLYRAWQSGIHSYRPCYWHRVGIPGSGGDQWYRADVEYVFCFKHPGKLPWAEPTANGHPNKCRVGGAMSYRHEDGRRKNAAVGVRLLQPRGSRRADGKIKPIGYTQPVKANPGNVVKAKVGGGIMGYKFAHENEAPFPVKLAEYFIRSHCQKGGIVLDPFSGSGTTVHAAYNLGRIGIGLDLRMSQCELGTRRMKGVTSKHELFLKMA